MREAIASAEEEHSFLDAQGAFTSSGDMTAHPQGVAGGGDDDNGHLSGDGWRVVLDMAKVRLAKPTSGRATTTKGPWHTVETFISMPFLSQILRAGRVCESMLASRWLFEGVFMVSVV